LSEETRLRRHILDISIGDISHRFTDILVLGSGAAGLRAAIEAAPGAKVVVVAKQTCEETNTLYAQGGIAAVLDVGDSMEEHTRDTIKAGQGLCQKDVVETIVSEGPDCIKELAAWGARFDRSGKSLAFAREGGHSRARIVHARGDATGGEIMATLVRKARSLENIRWLENAYAIDLFTDAARHAQPGGACRGALIHLDGALMAIWAKKVILATGGCGRIYRETTNPSVATGDGLAMAYRAGADLANMEFVQFHPTTLYVAGASRALISEAVRGEGARLVTAAGREFMKDYDPLGDLAPRDIVSRAILREMSKTGDTSAYLDLSRINHKHFAARFPNITRLCESFDIDIGKDLVPVRPSAHYLVGGVRTDLEGRTSVHNLLAAGEAANTGFHGANRLGSNSLLEAIVMGRRAGRRAAQEAGKRKKDAKPVPLPPAKAGMWGAGASIDLKDMLDSLRSLMWRSGGIIRNGADLNRALSKIRFWQAYVLPRRFDSPRGWELQNMLMLAEIIVHSALLRKESRGVHYRSDFPETDNKNWRRPTITKGLSRPKG